MLWSCLIYLKTFHIIYISFIIQNIFWFDIVFTFLDRIMCLFCLILNWNEYMVQRIEIQPTAFSGNLQLNASCVSHNHALEYMWNMDNSLAAHPALLYITLFMLPYCYCLFRKRLTSSFIGRLLFHFPRHKFHVIYRCIRLPAE